MSLLQGLLKNFRLAPNLLGGTVVLLGVSWAPSTFPVVYGDELRRAIITTAERETGTLLTPHALGTVTTPLTPKDTEPSGLSLEERLNRIEELLEQQRLNALPLQSVETGNNSPRPTSTNVEDTHSGQKWVGKLGGQVMADYANWTKAPPEIASLAQDLFNWRRVRLNYDATGYQFYEMRVQFDIEPDNELSTFVTEPYVAIKDIYLGMNELPGNSRLRVGNFFVPFSLEQLTPLPSVQFMERSIPTAGIFSPDREVGIAWYLLSEDKNRSASFGAFFDSIPESTKEVIDDNQGIRVSSRAVWLPIFNEASQGRQLAHLGLGVLYTQDRDENVRFRARPGEIRELQRLIDTGSLAAGSYLVANAEFAAVLGPFCIQSELYATDVNQIGSRDVVMYGNYLQASYFATGEHRHYDRAGNHLHHFGRTRPHENFSLKPGSLGLGAWEVKMRWAMLDFSDIDRGRYNEMTLGMNWYLNEHARWVFEWIRPWTDRQARVGNNLIGATESDVLAVRMQFTF